MNRQDAKNARMNFIKKEIRLAGNQESFLGVLGALAVKFWRFAL
jgi:hypothetical protein